jgi:hypothetical protein
MDMQSKKIARRAREWVASSKGQKSIKKAIEVAKENSDTFKRCRQIDPKLLKETFTI